MAIKSQINIRDEKAITELANDILIDVNRPSKNDGRGYDVWVEGQDITWEIRRPEIEAVVSIVSAYPGVRQAMTSQQRRIGMQGNVVMVGRDIGTVVLPEAGLKIYLNASGEARAVRRYQEVISRGEEAFLEEITMSLNRRDQIDSTREIAPLCPAKDAVIINTDDLSQDEVFEKVCALLK